MKNNKDQTLFHVLNIETLIHILNDKGFKTSYCKEEIRHGFNRENKGCIYYSIYIPMVSFTDMPLNSILKGDSTYGDCAIGMNIEWAKNKGLNPVLYLEQDSRISRAVWKILDDLTKNTSSIKLDLAATTLMQSIKNYEGDYKNKYINYYREREWRFVPELDEPYDSYISMEDCSKLNSLGKKPHIKEDKYLLKFTEKDIDYIVVNDKRQKREIVNILSNNGQKQLVSKIKIR